MSILLGLGQIGCGSDEHMCAITLGIVGQSLFFLFWLGTTTRTKRIGMWSEWLNPMLRVGVGTALAAGSSLKSPKACSLVVASSSLIMAVLRARNGYALLIKSRISAQTLH
ncbi:MAG: hypothetical protein IIB85_00475 [Chloroflexi bacterium]|nr:hypothetical protein [Chloroflexota bacterium]